MKLIFLDIDGVLNNDNWWKRNNSAGTPVRLVIDDTVDFDKDSMKVLNTIIEKTGAKVVISSSWRNYYPLEVLKKVLKDNGFVGEIIGKTPKSVPHPNRRGNQIQRWIHDNNFEGKFIILDDNADMEHLLPKLVQTSWANGLREEHIEKCLKLFGE